MESVLNRLRDTVSATVYQVTSNLSTALPGNPLTREYELIKQIGSAGPGLVFKIYNAIKKSTKEDAALFILEKKTLERFSKKEKEHLLDAIRHGVSQLTRLRHPSMLTVQHTLEESRDLIAFATEPVVGSLANLLDSNIKTDFNQDEDDITFYDVEIKYGLLQISEGLVFLHKDAKILHRNICPENIIINRNGIWKISGFDFSVQTISPNEQPYKYSSLQLLSDISLDVQANFTYAAPECFDNSQYIDASADIFSVGMLTYTLYNKGRPFHQFTPSFSYHKERYVDEVRNKLSSQMCLSCIPEESRNHVKLLLSPETSLRPDAQQISKLQIFQDVLVRTLQYFDSLFQWDNSQKAQFYKNLPEILVKFPKRVKLRRIIFGLAKEFVNPDMVPFVLPSFIQIAKDTTDEEFHTWIVPDLVPVFKYKEPIQIGIYLLQNMDFLVQRFKSKPDSLRENIIPLVYRFLESDAYQIQELCLSVIPSIIHLIDYTGSKNMLLPRVKKLALGTKLLSVRVNCLICLGKILEQLDKWLVLDEVLVLVMQMPSKEPAVIMASVGIFKLALNSNTLGITKEILASKIIPFLVPLSIENGLSLQQYNTVTSLIREMMNKIEEEHQAKLRQLESIKVKQDSFFNNNNDSSNPVNPSSNLSFDPFNLSTADNDTSKTPKVLSNPNSLSLEDKEQMAFQKDQSTKFKNESMLTPQTNSQSLSAYKNQTKDLTNSLINSNVNILDKPVSTSNFIQNNHNNSTYDSNLFNSVSQSSSKPAIFIPLFNTSNSQFNQVKPNLSPLDTLLVADINKKPVPQSLHSMMNTNLTINGSKPSPILNSNFNSQIPQSTKQLSKSELEEFLN